ncbi:MAG: TIGR01906 family membrane protein, partial [Clostridium sp.]|nr:TIGR01906 family membrane protein [Clostridium sp.]
MKKLINFVSALLIAILIITSSIIIGLNIKTAYYINIDKIYS